MNIKKLRLYGVLATETIVGLLISGGFLGLFIKFSHEVWEKELVSFDKLIMAGVYNWRTPPLTTVMLFLSNIGGQILPLIIILVLGLLWSYRYKVEALELSVATSGGILLNLWLKSLIQRPRPGLEPLLAETNYSFPSSHAMMALVVYGILAYISFQINRKKKIGLVIGIGALVLIGLVGMSRIYLGVHYPSDIVGGYIGGFFWLLTTITMEKTVVLYRRWKKIN